jgi:hypothetical protein
MVLSPEIGPLGLAGSLPRRRVQPASASRPISTPLKVARHPDLAFESGELASAATCTLQWSGLRIGIRWVPP